MKNLTLGYFCKSTYSQDSSLEDHYCVPLFTLKFLIPTLRQKPLKPSNIYEESDFTSYVSRNKMEKYTVLWFKKEAFISNGRKI